MPSDHVGLEHYLWVKSGRMQPGELLRLIHRARRPARLSSRRRG
jgi:hypothetical protein